MFAEIDEDDVELLVRGLTVRTAFKNQFDD